MGFDTADTSHLVNGKDRLQPPSFIFYNINYARKSFSVFAHGLMILLIQIPLKVNKYVYVTSSGQE